MQCISGGEFSHLCYVITFLNLREWMTNTLKIILISDLIYTEFFVSAESIFKSNSISNFETKKKTSALGANCQVVSRHLKLLLKVIF